MDDEERDERMEWPAEKDQCECECQCVFPPVTVDLDLSDVTFFHKLCSIDPDTQTPARSAAQTQLCSGPFSHWHSQACAVCIQRGLVYTQQQISIRRTYRSQSSQRPFAHNP